MWFRQKIQAVSREIRIIQSWQSPANIDTAKLPAGLTGKKITRPTAEPASWIKVTVVEKQPIQKLLPVEGVRLSAVSAGIKESGRRDLVVIEIAGNARVAAVFTRNRFLAAPVVIAKKHLQQSQPRFLIINSGNANAGTGSAGLQDALACCQKLAELGRCDAAEVLPFSTGVIGESLPVAKILRATGPALANLKEEHWAAAASAIMTTDTRSKGLSVTTEIDGVSLTITGICKGAGMIRPDMATMLAYVATDAPVEQNLLQALLKEAVTFSFNRITVDGDTSTNDACILIATGKAKVKQYCDISDPSWQPYRQALNQVFLKLAQDIVRDAEGATKFIEVRVEGAATASDALEVACTIAHSPLVKTAFFASDPNWGRILAAIGRAPVTCLDVAHVDLWLNEICIVENGERCKNYTEQAGKQVMSQRDIVIRIHLGVGEASESVWTSDLSHGYVRINAEYRT